ncbi:LysR family transcriptional regulator [Isoalcanivorax pacificus W11-5]|uniref:LysR family transcriptional regulator n=1 Tax=Isoalcanivorax pacificus W11-5 TaxID=391936 RepID=A0A0B4XMU7_9GAMM|nr:LysR family transcriptional regulator [Isoalcanivorax pacificus]AJD48421.1 LysR family transcriptional regulator [Isoalcanivorax pacificus W11-5]
MNSITDLSIFVGVVKAGTISGAGRRLGLSPASISKRLARLEEEIGVRLLNRSSRAMSLTEEGKILYHKLLVILDDLEEATSSVSRAGDNAKGTLKVASTVGLGKSRIASLIAEFSRNNPELVVQLYLGDKQIDFIREGFDVAIAIGQPSDSTMIAKRLLKNRCFVCASPEYLEGRSPIRKPSDLKKHECLILDSYGSFRDLWPLCGPNHREMVRVTGSLITDNSETLRNWVLSGYGIAIKSEWDVKNELRTGKLVTLLEGYTVPNMDFYIIYGSRKNLPAKTRNFVKFIEERIHQA